MERMPDGPSAKGSRAVEVELRTLLDSPKTKIVILIYINQRCKTKGILFIIGTTICFLVIKLKS